MIDMILGTERRDIAATQCTPTFCTQQVEAPKVIRLAQWKLLTARGLHHLLRC